MSFVANLIRFPAVQKLRKSVKIWQSYGEFKGGNFLRHSVVFACRKARAFLVGLGRVTKFPDVHGSVRVGINVQNMLCGNEVHIFCNVFCDYQKLWSDGPGWVKSRISF